MTLQEVINAPRKESENDIFRFPQINIGSQKAAIRLFATLSNVIGEIAAGW
jgi:hypothetical protein